MPQSNPKPTSSSNNNNNNNSSTKSANAGKTATGGPGSQGGTGVSKNFTESYGLKFHEPGDYQEAQNIQQAFRDADAKYGGR